MIRYAVLTLWMAAGLAAADNTPGIFTPESTEFLTRFLNTPSPSTREGEAQQMWLDRVSPHADSVGKDEVGNAWAEFESPQVGAPTLVIVSHIDEVGLEVMDTTPRGFVKVKLLGHPDPDAVASVPYVFHGTKGPVPAFAGCKPRWWEGMKPDETVSVDKQLDLLATEMNESANCFRMSWLDRLQMRQRYADAIRKPDERNKGRDHLAKWAAVEFDVGADDAAQVEQMGIVPGTLCMPATKAEIIAENRLIAHGLDNRLHVFLLSELAPYLAAHKNDLQYNVVLLSVVREEMGLLGSFAYFLKNPPEQVIALDCTVDSMQYPDEQFEGLPVSMGKGPVLQAYPGSMPGNARCRFDRKMNRSLENVAREKGIPLQKDTFKMVGVSDFLPAMMLGGRATMIGCPVRYMHSPREMADLRDAAALLKLIQSFVTAPPEGAPAPGEAEKASSEKRVQAVITA